MRLGGSVLLFAWPYCWLGGAERLHVSGMAQDCLSGRAT